MLYFQFHIGDWESGTRLMTPLEKGVYLELLIFYYSVERPITEDECKRIARGYANADADALAYVLETHFQKEGDSYRHKKCDEVIAEFHAISAKRSSAARKSAEARKNKRVSRSDAASADANVQANADANAQANVCAKSELTINHKPLTITKELETPYGVSRRLSFESSTPDSAVSSSEKEEIFQAPQSADASVNDSAADKASRKAAPVPYEKIVDLYNAKLGPVLGMCRDLNAARRSALKSRWADVASAIGVSHYDTADVLEGFGEYFDKIARSDFLMGRRSDGGWHATFDWLIKSSNYLKVFEGNYENSRRK